jgi:DNA glycosylase AlkZ-like
VLVDGFAAGMWRITRSRGTAVLTVESFGPLAAADRDAVTAEGGRLLGFAAAGAAHEIRFGPIG